MREWMQLTTALVVTASTMVFAQGDDVRKQLLPTGKLRVGINAGNVVSRAVAMDVGRDLAKRFGTEVAFVEYPTPGAVTDAVGTAWDIAFVAADPDREAQIAFTPPYMALDATYLVRADSSIRSVHDVDRDGVKIATGATSAYTLLLKRELKRATLVFHTPDEAVKALQGRTADAAAGLRDALVKSAARVPGLRVLDDNFTRAQQAVAVPKGHSSVLSYMTGYLTEVKRSGFIAASIQRTGVIGVTVVP